MKPGTAISAILIALFGHYYGRYYLKDIAILFAQDPYAVSRSLHHCLNKAKTDPKLQKLINLLEYKFLEISRSDPTVIAE